MSRVRLSAVLAVLALSLVSAGLAAGAVTSSKGGTAGPLSTSIKPRTIGVLDLIRLSPIDNTVDLTIEAAGKALGWNVKIIDAQGDPQKVLRGGQALIAQKVDGLITVSVDDSMIRQSLTDARSGGIPTCAVGGDQAPSKLYDAQFTENAPTQGRLAAQSIIQENPNAKVVILRSTTIFTGRERYNVFKATLQKSNAKIVFDREIGLSDSIGNTTKALEDALAANPDATSVWAEYDNFAQPSVTTLQRLRSKAKVWTYFLTPADLKNLRANTPLYGVNEMPFAKGAAVCLDQFIGKFEKGQALDRTAMQKIFRGSGPYAVVTRKTLESVVPASYTPNGNFDAAYPPEKLLASFFARWQKLYPKS